VPHQAFIPAPHQHINSCDGEIQTYCDTKFAGSGVKSDVDSEKLERIFSKSNSTKLFSNRYIAQKYVFSTLYSTIPHDKSKPGLINTIENCFSHKTGKGKYSYLVISHQKHYFVKYHPDCTHKYSEVEIKKMLEFLIDNVYVAVGGHVLQQSV
jgi:hypothetical protein